MQGDDCEFIDLEDNHVSYFVKCEHLARYIYASEQIRKRKAQLVLDAACGSGYGSAELAKYAKHVFALDKINPLPKYQRSNITFTKTDLNATGFVSSLNIQKKLDAAVCFETLEHLREPKEFLLSIAQIIKNTGLLFVSVPNGEFEKSDENGNLINEFHLHKFEKGEIQNLVEECGFTVKRELYQPTSANLLRNEARAIRDLKLDTAYAQKMSPDINDIHYYSRLYAWPDENKGQSYSIMLMCERRW